MTEGQRKKVGLFLQDEELTKILYDILLESFLRTPKSTDVQTLAAYRIAIDLFREGWRELQGFRLRNKEENFVQTNIAL